MSFSVVIPSHNRSRKLARALASVVAQEGEQPEIIVVDDASSPEEAALTAKVVAETPGATLIRQDVNIGAARARNIGIEAARGSIVAFLDSDDWWAPGRLAAHRRAFDAGDHVASYNMAWLVRSEAQQPTGTLGRAKPERWPLKVALAGWNFVGSCSSVCVRTDALRQVGGFDPEMPSCQDWDLWLRLSLNGDFRFVAEPLTFFDAGPHARITTSRRPVEVGHALMHAKAAQVASDDAERSYIAAEHYWTDAEIATRFGEPRLALRKMFASLREARTHRALLRAPAIIVKNVIGTFR